MQSMENEFDRRHQQNVPRELVKSILGAMKFELDNGNDHFILTAPEMNLLYDWGLAVDFRMLELDEFVEQVSKMKPDDAVGACSGEASDILKEKL